MIPPLPSISVVIPAFGRPEALLRAIDSVRASDIQGVEIVVVDDASPQSLAPIVPPVNAHGIAVRYYRLPSNGGPQAARNLGIRRARFDYIAFLDSDDVFLPDKIDRVRHHLADTPCDLVFHNVEGLATYGRIGRLWDRRLRKILPFDWLLAFLNPVPTPALVLRRTGRLGLPRLRHAEDWAFLLHVVRPGLRVTYIDASLSQVHRALGSAGGQSGARWAMRRGEFRARAMLLKERGIAAGVKYALGTVAGCARIAWDIARLRYWIGGERG